MRLVVTGARGLLGRAVAREAYGRGHEVRAFGRQELDVTDREVVERRLAEEEPAAVVHCAAFTDVDGAETEVERATRVNVEGAGNVADATRAVGARLLHLSTDYVFDGRSRRPYVPRDPPRPLNAYGRTKLEGERRVLAAGGPALVVRTSALYGPGGRNFVDTVRALARERGELEVVMDQRTRPTRAGSLARSLLDLVEGAGAGRLLLEGRVLHAADGGTASWFELAREVAKIDALAAHVRGVSATARPGPAARPSFSVLDLTETEGLLQRSFPHWRQELRAHLGKEIEEGP